MEGVVFISQSSNPALSICIGTMEKEAPRKKRIGLYLTSFFQDGVPKFGQQVGT
jgi:hypothetical protein